MAEQACFGAPRKATAQNRRAGWVLCLVWVLGALWPRFAAEGLDGARRVTQYMHQAWRDELPQATVQDVLQTPDGYLWLATQEGLVRFDGIRFVTFTPQNTPWLGNADILALFVDARGLLWIGTRGGGLATYREGEFGAAPGDLQGVEGGVISGISGDRSGRVWVGTQRGLLRWDGEGWTRFGREDGLPRDAVTAVLEDSRGSVWVGTRDSGLSRLDDGRFVPWSPTVGNSDMPEVLDVVCLTEGRQGDLWIGTRSHGLFRFHGAEITSLTTADGLTSDTIFDLNEDRDGNLWIATYGGGLNRFDGEEIAAFTTADGLTNDIVLSLFEDREGSVWVGTAGGGLNRLRDGALSAFTTREGLLSNHVYCVLEDRSGVLWIGTEGGGLGRLEDDRVTTLTMADGLSSNHVTALLEDRSGALWVGTREAGLNRLQDGIVTTYSRHDGLSSDSIFSLIEDADGKIWIGTVRGGLSIFEGDRILPYTGDRELSTVSILALALDADGRVLVGTEGAGLKILSPGGNITLNTANGLSNDIVVSLYTDPAGTLWAGTYGGGLNRIRGREITPITTRDGLFDDRIFQILSDESGRLWMSCNRGIFSVSKHELDAFGQGLTSMVTSVAYGKDHGMRASECAAGTHPTGWRGTDGVLWFPTIEGVVRLDPANLRPNEIAPPVRIESVLIDGEAYSPRDSPSLKPGKERFELTYTGLSLLVPEKLRFRYQLEGFDRDWVAAGNARSTIFTNLPTGKRYRFVVTAANNDGVWNQEGAAFSFYLERHFYETPSFVALCGVLLLFLGRGAYRLRVRRLLRRTQELEQKVAERTAEVVAEKERVETANQELEKLNQIKSEFLAIAAHDLKNPLTLIYGYSGLIGKGERPERRVKEMARSIAASVSQMLNTIGDLLDTTAIESGKLRLSLRMADLAMLVIEVLEHNSIRAAERGIRLAFRVEPEELYTALVDPERISRVFDNLISNAIKFSTDGQSIDIGLERLVVGDAPILRFSVRDQGPGLSEEDKEKLFRRFESLSAKPAAGDSSSGLGLSIVKKFVELHGGEVRAESRLGEGATFLVDLPTAEEAAETEPRSSCRPGRDSTR